MSGKRFRSIESKHEQERAEFFDALSRLDRRAFLRVAGLSAGVAAGLGVFHPQSFQLVEVAHAEGSKPRFSFAYISDTHLYERKLNDRFVRSILRAVDDVNALDPQPDFVLFGGDLAQLGQPQELELGREILKSVKAPVRMMVGEHDWFLDMGEAWKSMFGPDTYAFDHKGVHFVVLNSIHEKDFWTERGLKPMERMKIVAGLDNGIQSRFEVGAQQREWLRQDLAKQDKKAPLIVFSHSPLYKYYRPWNFWTEDADEVQALLAPFEKVTVIHGHTHQLLTNRIGNIHFHGMLSTAWPWPYAPEGLPRLTVQMNRPDPFSQFDGCGNGRMDVLEAGLVDTLYNLWERNPVSVRASYVAAASAANAPPRTKLPSY
ncbi:serine/threonine protein phosphatase [Aggregicoccus sp. 17bor-14]|uniref:metallophosphoesterase family protein n=1 Tax=Myxococcaceae TaxID=31 RepID=UPI00129CFED2|nr:MULTISPECIES: metallophosphoesterase [Myxococcaceae]MBF5045927.1 metallophosphoesterase [Simulacricoccus sp. 17bor-14]MRI91661.1 serine/threonine protein phosphatase [Aggregicoccus sp. 17bor-14]